jgi:hypothetical protein
VALEERGIPTLTIVTERFEGLAKAVSESLDRDDLPLLVIPHPFGGIPEEEVRGRAEEVARKLPVAIWEAARKAPAPVARSAGPLTEGEPRMTLLVDVDETSALEEQGLTDGLPVVPPTPARVAAMLEYAGRDRAHVIGPLPPAWRNVGLEAVAANAVMAGCVPEAFPVVLQAVEAMLSEPAFNLHGMQTTTHPIGPMVIVCGPVAEELGVWGGIGCLGPGWRANATIGRAVRLILANCGGARPGELDKATMGQPGKYSFCFSENEGDSPWPSYRSDRGFGSDDSTVTVVGAEAPLNINDHGSTSSEGILRTIAGTMSTTGNNNLYWLGDTFLILGPEHAQTLAREGLSKGDVQTELHLRVRIPVDRMSNEHFAHLRSWIHEDEIDDYVDPEGRVALVREPKDIHILVAGGPGKHSMWVPTWFRSVTRTIVDQDGESVRSIRYLRKDDWEGGSDGEGRGAEEGG